MKKSQIEGSQSTSVFSHSLQMEDTTATSTQGVKPPKVGPFLAS
jgi:hypothetical protein